MNNSDNLKKEKELLKKYGIENRDWDDSNIKRKPLSELTEEEKKQKEELKKKEEEEKKIKLEKLINSLQKQEIFIKNNFLRTKKNTKKQSIKRTSGNIRRNRKKQKNFGKNKCREWLFI